MYDKRHRLLVAEGHPVEDGLCSVRPERLVAVQEAICDELEAMGVEVPRDPAPFERTRSAGLSGIRRLDLAVDAEGDAAVGRAMLSGAAAVEPPGRLRSSIHRAQVGRGIETVSWEGAKGKVARSYDKGVEALTHAAGERVRFEDQRRFASGARILPAELAPELARHFHAHRFAPMVAAMKGVKVTTISGAVHRVQELVEQGDLTPATAQKLIGHLVCEREGVGLGSRPTQWRRRREARELGLVLADGSVEEFEVDLGSEFERVAAVAWDE